MFTGLIEAIGKVESAKLRDGDLRLVVAIKDFESEPINSEPINIGDSIALNGACMTVVDINQATYAFDVSKESLNHTLMGSWKAGDEVNCERALLPTTRMGGHIVTGHIDGLAQLVDLSSDARSWRMRFAAPQELKKYIAKKGSVTINGISLTVNEVDDEHFEVNIIPHTFDVTTLNSIQVGDRVHIEVDLIARYLERLLQQTSSKKAALSIDDLTRAGFA